MLSKIMCNVIVVLGQHCLTGFRGSDNTTKEEYAVIKKNAKYFELCEVPGNHFVHLNNPVIVADKINCFLRKLESKSKL